MPESIRSEEEGGELMIAALTPPKAPAPGLCPELGLPQPDEGKMRVTVGREGGGPLK